MDVSDAHAALERGRALMLVTPPAVEQADAVWTMHSNGMTVVVCSDLDGAEAWADQAPEGIRVHAVTSLERSTRLLKEGAVDVLAGTPEDLQALVSRSALKLDAIPTVVLAWPEGLIASDRLEAIEPLLAEHREGRRIVLAWNPPMIEDLLERYARRPHVIGDLPLGEDARPLPPVASARYAVVPRARRTSALREVLDALNRTRVVQWRRGDASTDVADAVICLDLPTRDELTRIAARGEPVLLVSPGQLAYAHSIAAPLTALPLRASRERSAATATALRDRLAARLEAGGLEAELGLLEPLLQRYDAAEVAAALLAIGHRPTAISSERPTLSTQQPTGSPEWIRVFVNVGKKDRASAKDFVGALTREVGLDRTDIGRIELRDAFCLLDIASHAADKAIVGLTRTTIRGRRPAAHRDRAG